jgi:Cof subfamily protein (haloacid dehalogenase superfamily)
MKTLYLSDLDGTLLHSTERISEYTANIINRFTQSGGYFSYATARSIVTASKVATGLNTGLPVICCNGAFIYGNPTKEILLSNFFTLEEVKTISETLMRYNMYPNVNSYICGVERLSYIERYVTPAMQHYLNNRNGDPRRRVVDSINGLYRGNVFRITCMDTAASLSMIEKIFQSDNRFNCVITEEPYSGEISCEILPLKATKSNAALQLKEMLNCDRIVAFGDERNDLSLFSVADESYAMANAVPELKEIATAIIDSNDNDGVAKWIEKNAM